MIDQDRQEQLLEEIETFAREFPDIQSVDLLSTDLNGIMRGKRLTMDRLRSVAKSGLQLPASVFASNITGDSVAETGLVWENGDADSSFFPVPGTLVRAPWREAPSAQMLIEMRNEDGIHFHGDPRSVLEKVAARFRNRGLTPVIALELEFYIFDGALDESGKPQPAKSSLTGERQGTTQVYGLDELDDFQSLLDEIDVAASVQKLPVDTAIAEYSPGQFEINLKHQDDPVRAADQAQLLKRTIRNVTRAHGAQASFMAKPLIDCSGNGLHIHCSLLDQDGKNVFANEDDKLGSATLRHAIGGLTTTMADTMAILAPNANSFRRLRPNSYVPLSPCWGHNNRTVAFRIPAGPVAATRFEHRVAGADANPYLATAAVLAAALHGIENELDPGEPVTGNAYESVKPTMPETWKDAIDCFSQSEFITSQFGSAFRDLYAIVKTDERRAFESEVTPLELQWYMRTV